MVYFRHLNSHVKKSLFRKVLLPLLYYFQVKAAPFIWYSSDRSAEWERMYAALCGTNENYQTFLYGTPYISELHKYRRLYFEPERPQGLFGVQPHYGYSGVFMPGKISLARTHTMNVVPGKHFFRIIELYF